MCGRGTGTNVRGNDLVLSPKLCCWLAGGEIT